MFVCPLVSFDRLEMVFFPISLRPLENPNVFLFFFSWPVFLVIASRSRCFPDDVRFVSVPPQWCDSKFDPGVC